MIRSHDLPDMNIFMGQTLRVARTPRPAAGLTYSAYRLRSRLLVLSVIAILLLSACSRIGTPQGWSAGAVNDDTLFIGTIEGEVLAVDKETGAERWRRPLPTSEDTDRAIYGRPAVTDTAVMVGGYDGVLYAYDPQGNPLWEERFVGRIVGGPTVHQNVAYVGTGEVSSSDGSAGALHAVDIELGDPIWSFQTSGPVWSTPVITDGVAFVGSLDHHVYAVDIADGTEKWRFKSGGAISSGLAIHGNLLIFGGFDSKLYALDSATGRPVWDFSGSTRWYWTAPIVEDETVYAPSLDGTLYALDASTGELEWSYTTGGQLVGSPAIVNDLIAVPVADGGDSVIALLETNGSEQGLCRIGSDIRTSIEVSDDLLYFGAVDHTIRALRVKPTGNPDEEWIYVTDEDDPYPRGRAKAC